MKNLYTKALVAFCTILTQVTIAQTDTTHYKYGLWQSFGDAASSKEYPEIQGRLSNISWKYIEPSPNVWDWKAFDEEMTSKAADGLPIIFLVYTKQDAPEWIYSNGVPKVTEKDEQGKVTGYSPYYKDADYKFFFKRMVETVKKHVDQLPANVRSSIIGVQPCFGSTGDYISYKGTVAPEYALSYDDFLALFQEFTKYYYEAYQGTNPKIYLLNNPNNNGQEQMIWLQVNCPGNWIKTGTLGKGFQLNFETDKASWLMPMLNMAGQGGTMRARSELMGGATTAPWWKVAPYKNMFTIMAYAIHWGMDWSNQSMQHIGDHGYDPAYQLYNKYAGFKDAATSNNAMCMLKDALDASDEVRFPSSQYGPVAMTADRFNKVLAPFVGFGAKLEDMNAALKGEMENIAAKGTNDVGWKIFPGNYEKFLHQINANETSAGYWNVNCADVNTAYGRFARGFDLSKGKDALYFNVEDAFLHNAPLNGEYPVTIDITYLDKGTGKWKIFYDGKINAATEALSVTGTNTNKWKTVSVKIDDAYFGNRGANGADFYIKNTGTENVIFALVELGRPSAGVSGSTLTFANAPSFDTVCVNSTPVAQQFTITGLFLNSSPVIIGKSQGFTYSLTQDGVYTDSIVIKEHNATFTQSVYAKFVPTEARSYNTGIPVYGGGATTTFVTVKAVAVNTAPDLSASVIAGVSCNNKKDGSIDLRPAGGQSPFTYSWAGTATRFKSTEQDVNSLQPDTYNLTVNSAHGCKLVKTYVISQPEKLEVSVTGDEMTCRGGQGNVYVTAKGGTLPYTGTGTFLKNAGFEKYKVTDKNGCIDEQGYSLKSGSNTAPQKPGLIESADADATGVCGAGTFTFSVNAVSKATSYTWIAPANSSISSTSDGGRVAVLKTEAGFKGGTLSVKAGNTCGTSEARTETLETTPARPGGIVGTQSVKSNQTGLVYSTAALPGLTYVWTVPASAKIVSGQNTSKITVDWGARAGDIKVQAVNNCSSSMYTRISVDLKDGLLSNTVNSSMKTTPQVYELKASPNPARSVTNLTFNADVEYRYTIEITDMSGKVVLRKTGISRQGYNSVVTDVSGLAYGMFNISVINNDNGERITTKLVKG